MLVRSLLQAAASPFHAVSSMPTGAVAMATLMPVLFLGHGGGPCYFMDRSREGGPMAEIDKNSPSGVWYAKTLAKTLPVPKAICVVSAHWEEKDVTIQTNPKPDWFYDYGDFGPGTFELHKKHWIPGIHPGATPDLVKRVQALLSSAGIKHREDRQRGWDHGVFNPLAIVFPDPVPTFQVSLRGDLDPAAHIAVGQALAPLRAEGVLIVASGYLTHNLREFFVPRPGGDFVEPWAAAFDHWVASTLLGDEVAEAHKSTRKASSTPVQGGAVTWRDASQKLINTSKLAPSFRKAHPREEHYIPLLVAVGAADHTAVRTSAAAAVGADGSASSTAAGADDKLNATRIFSQMVGGQGSMACYRFD